MTYSEDLETIARQLAVIGVRGTTELSDHDLDVALTARAGVLELATLVQRDITGQPARSTSPIAARLEANPVTAFNDALRFHPRVTLDASPSQILGRGADSEIGRNWHLIARHAISAHHHWTTGAVRVTGPTAWAGLADIAALSAVVAELDADLTEAALKLPDRGREVAQLRHGFTSGLRIAARQVSELAAKGPLAQGPEPQPPGNRGVVTITSAADVATAHEQLANLLRTAEHVRPERVALMVIGHLKTCQSVLKALPRATSINDRDLRRRMTDHVEALRETTRYPTLASSVHGGDTTCLQQMRIIRHALGSGASTLLTATAKDPEAVARLARAIADTTGALRQTADRQVATQQWLLPDPDTLDVRWRVSQTWHDVPAHLRALRLASVKAEHLASWGSQRLRPEIGSPPRASRAAPRDLLRPAPHQLLSPDRQGNRPRYPATQIRRR